MTFETTVHSSDVPNQRPLDTKINEAFAGSVVRKDLVKAVKGNAIVPSYVLEYLLGQYCATDDEETIQAGINTVRDILKQHYVHRNEAGLTRSVIKEKGRHKVIDRVSVALNDKVDVYEAEFANLGIKGVLLDSATVKKHPKLLVGGVWCICDVEYSHTDDQRVVPWIMGSIKPIQLSSFDSDAYLSARREFSTDEWIDLLVQSIGFNPDLFGRRAKLIQMVRLIPFVERNYNLVELGPKGTGKSHIFSEFSPHGMLISGGEVTVPKLFVNNSNGRLGLVGYWDVVAFDEFAGKKKRTDRALVDIMKNYMANKTFSRGVETIGAEASMAFVGNTSHTVPHMLKYSDLFDELPESYHDSAFLDRLHHYVPGWEVEIIRGEMFSTGYGFVVDYIAEILKSMRSEDFSDRYAPHFTLSSDLSSRDRDAINKTFSGLMKIMFPHGEATTDEIEDILRLSMEGRKRVKDQILRIDKTMTAVNFGYTDAGGVWHEVSTLEELEYPELYHRKRDQGSALATGMEAGDALPEAMGAAGVPQTVGPSENGPLTLPAPEPLFEGLRQYSENQRGVTHEKILIPYFVGATRVKIVDPYIREFHQIRNLVELIEAIAGAKSPADEVTVSLLTSQNAKGQDLLMRQIDLLAEVEQGVSVAGVRFEFDFDEAIHDRSISTDTGWTILLGRGLDFYQKPEGGQFDFTTRVQQYRQVKEFGVTYIRDQNVVAGEPALEH